MPRLADRWSLGYLALTMTIAPAAWWFTCDPIRAVAVPVALVADLPRAAHFGWLVKGTSPLEAMARTRTLILDKTEMLTDGRPRIVSIDSHDGTHQDDILRFGAALDQASKHPVAQAIVVATKARGLALPVPLEVAEIAGQGVIGLIDRGRRRRQFYGVPRRTIVGRPPGTGGGIGDREGRRRRPHRRVSGHGRPAALRVTEGLGLDGLRARLTPDQKTLLVLSERKNGLVMMIGNGVNDAPAMAAADVGVAMGARSIDRSDCCLMQCAGL
jgi:cation transport ATPase